MSDASEPDPSADPSSADLLSSVPNGASPDDASSPKTPTDEPAHAPDAILATKADDEDEARQRWLTPYDIVRAFLRCALILLVPVISTFSQGPSVTRIAVVLSFSAAIVLPTFCEAWARGVSERIARVHERALLFGYLGCWVPVLEVFYFQAIQNRNPGPIADLLTPDPATARALLVCAVALLPVASTLAAGSLIHMGYPYSLPGTSKFQRRIVGFTVRQSLLVGALMAALAFAMEGYGIAGVLTAAALGSLCGAGAIAFGGVLLAAVYLVCDSFAGFLVRPPPEEGTREALRDLA